MVTKPRYDHYVVHLNDECRNIGSGRRLVEVLSIGHKWVTLRYKRADHYVRNRVPRTRWDELLAGKNPPVKL